MKPVVRIILDLLCVMTFVSSANNMCTTSICLDWKLGVNGLTLTCRITNLHLRVYIDDPYGNTQAVCLPPYQLNCEAYYKNGSTSYNIITKEIKFKVNREMGQNVEGYWTCSHGTGRDISKVFVSMKITTVGEGSQSTAYNDTIVDSTIQKTDKTTTAAPTLMSRTSTLSDFKYYSDLVTGNEELLLTQYMSTEVDREQTNVKLAIIFSKFYGLFIGAACLLLFMFVVCNIWISRRCRSTHLKIEDIGGQNNSNETAEHANALDDIDKDDREGSISEYDSIDENDMLPFPFRASFAIGTNDSMLDQGTNYSGKHGNTSSSDNSYLEVIDDDPYLNPYQCIQINDESEIVHDYCTTSAFDNLQLCSANISDVSPNAQYYTCDADVNMSREKIVVKVQFGLDQYATVPSDEMKDTEMIHSSSFQSKSLKNNPFLSKESTVVHENVDAKTAFAGKLDNSVLNEACSLPSTSMSTLL